MANKFGKFLLFSALAGAAAYGAYSYLQKKEQPLASVPEDEADDDFDDFSEDLDEDLNSGKSRSYVSLNLDKAEAFANEAFHKAKEVISDSVQQVKETVKSVADSQVYHSSFTDLTHMSRDEDSKDTVAGNTDTQDMKDEDRKESISETPEASEFFSETETISTNAGEDSTGQVEEFFDDDTE